MGLPPAPASLEDGSGAPRFGTYQGVLELVNLGSLRGAFKPNAVERLQMHKKWLYWFIATPELAVLSAVVDVGYTSNAFAMAVDFNTGRVLADASFLGPPRPIVVVNDHPGAGLDVAFTRPDARFRAHRAHGDQRYHLHTRLGLPLLPAKLSVRAELLAAEAAPPLTVVAPVDGGVVNVTQKWAGLLAFGELEAGGKRYLLDGGVGGLDSTFGYLARHTAWRWAFGCGRLANGTPVGFNFVEGFNESRDDVNENAVWLGGALYPVGRARFEWSTRDVLERWHVTTVDGKVDLTLTPVAAHREHRDLKLVKSHFSQPVGRWSGTLVLDGVKHHLDGVPGVTEEQDILW